MMIKAIQAKEKKMFDEIDTSHLFTDMFNQNFVEHLKEKNDERDKSWWAPEKDTYHVTDITGCLRKSFLKKKVNIELDESSLKNFEIGHRVEDIAAKALEKMYDNVENDYRITKEFNGYKIKGETDPILKVNNKILDMFEIKSTSYISSVKDKPKSHHLRQVNAYMGLLGLHSCKIIYIDKKNYSDLAHHIPFDKDMFRDFKNKAEWLHTCFKNEKIPAAKPMENWECKWCDVRDICDAIKKNGEDEILQNIKKECISTP